MKRPLSLFLTLALTLALTACGSPAGQTGSDSIPDGGVSVPASPEASAPAENPETPYTSDDLNYNDSSSRSGREMDDPDARPAISGSVDNMEQYDVIFLGYPIWWGQVPKIIYTFLESYDLGGKTIVPFCTSGSSGIGSSASNLHNLASNAIWLNGQRFSGGASRSTVKTWVNGLGLTLAPAA